MQRHIKQQIRLLIARGCARSPAQPQQSGKPGITLIFEFFHQPAERRTVVSHRKQAMPGQGSQPAVRSAGSRFPAPPAPL